MIKPFHFARSARRHRVGTARARHVIAHPYVVFTEDDPQGRATKTIYLGDDPSGRALEVVTVETHDAILVIHVMDLGRKYRHIYETYRDRD